MSVQATLGHDWIIANYMLRHNKNHHSWTKTIPGKAYLADDVPVGEADNHPVLGCVVLVLILNDKALTSKEVGLSLWKEETLEINSNDTQKSPPHEEEENMVCVVLGVSPLLLLNLTWYLLK